MCSEEQGHRLGLASPPPRSPSIHCLMRPQYFKKYGRGILGRGLDHRVWAKRTIGPLEIQCAFGFCRWPQLQQTLWLLAERSGTPSAPSYQDNFFSGDWRSLLEDSENPTHSRQSHWHLDYSHHAFSTPSVNTRCSNKAQMAQTSP